MREDDEQRLLLNWAAMIAGRYPDVRLLYHIPNEGKRSMATGGRLKGMGLKKGVPDLCLPVQRGTYHGLYIEMKRADGGSATKEQKEWLRALDAQGYAVTLCHGWQAAAKEIETYLKLPKGETEHDRKTNGGAGQAHAGAEADGSGTA